MGAEDVIDEGRDLAFSFRQTHLATTPLLFR